ncbi:MAG: hypothetical protein O3A00_00585 [Planctomycetota bacterium]|nr:hypothetical protein [Planctomycetota bacterium]
MLAILSTVQLVGDEPIPPQAAPLFQLRSVDEVLSLAAPLSQFSVPVPDSLKPDDPSPENPTTSGATTSKASNGSSAIGDHSKIDEFNRPHVTFLNGKTRTPSAAGTQPKPLSVRQTDANHQRDLRPTNPPVRNVSRENEWNASPKTRVTSHQQTQSPQPFAPPAADTTLRLQPPIISNEVLPGAANPILASAVAAATEMQQLLAQVEADTELTSVVKTEQIQKLKQALESLKIAETGAATSEQYRADVKNVPVLMEQLKLELGKTSVEVVVDPPREETLVQLEQRQAAVETELLGLQKSVEKTTGEEATRADRKTKLPGLIDKTQQDLAAARAVLSAATGGDAIVAKVGKAELVARVLRLESQLSLFQIEGQRQDARAPLLTLQNELLQRKIAEQKKVVVAWKEVVTNFRRAEAERQAREARDRVADAHPALHELAERNAALAEERVKLAALIETTTKQFEAGKQELTDVTDSFTKVKNKQKAAGLTTAIGLYLRNQRDRLPDRAELVVKLGKMEAEISRIQLAGMALRDEQKDIADQNASIQRIMAGVDWDRGTVDNVNVRQMVEEMLASKRG